MENGVLSDDSDTKVAERLHDRVYKTCPNLI